MKIAFAFPVILAYAITMAVLANHTEVHAQSSDCSAVYSNDLAQCRSQYNDQVTVCDHPPVTNKTACLQAASKQYGQCTAMAYSDEQCCEGYIGDCGD